MWSSTAARRVSSCFGYCSSLACQSLAVQSQSMATLTTLLLTVLCHSFTQEVSCAPTSGVEPSNGAV
eukprot:1918824-Amphidinium_carterae.2